MPDYTVKNVKSFTGREGYGFNASLYKDGKKVALVIDSANGGPYQYQFDDRKDEAEFLAYVKSIPEFSGVEGEDTFMAGLVDTAEITKKLRATLKRNWNKHTIISNEGKVLEWKVPFSEKADAELARRYPSAIVLNKLPFEQAAAIYCKVD